MIIGRLHLQQVLFSFFIQNSNQKSNVIVVLHKDAITLDPLISLLFYDVSKQRTQLSFMLSSVLTSSSILLFILLFVSLLSNGQTSGVFFSLTLFSSPDPLYVMLTVIVLGYLQQAHCSIHSLVQRNNK